MFYHSLDRFIRNTDKKTLPLTPMLLRLKKYVSVFLFTVFLYPLVSEQVHNLHHRNDKHCTELNTVHFHVTEHYCSICDFVPTIANEPTEQEHSLTTFYFSSNFFTFYLRFATSSQHFNYSLRGPPFIS